MKHIRTFKILALFVAAALAGSCLKEDKDVFGKSSADRVTEAMKNYEELLNAAPNGWQMNYFAELAPNLMGGFPILCAFNNGLVTMSADLNISRYTAGTYTSGYSFRNTDGVVLCLDTYNPLIHYFSDVTSTSNADGYAGDHEFVVESASADRFVMRGLKCYNKIIMTPLGKDVDWDTHIDSCNLMNGLLADYHRFEVYKGSSLTGMVSIAVTEDLAQRTLDVTEGDNPFYTFFTNIPGGIMLLEETDIYGTVTERLMWDEDAGVFNSTGDDGAAIRFEPVFLDYEDYLGTYSVNASNLMDPITVTVSENVRGSSFTVSDELFGYPFTVNYGSRRIETPMQILATLPSGNIIRLVGVTSVLGLLESYTTSGQMYGVWDKGTRNNNTINFVAGDGNILFSGARGFRVREYNGSAAVQFVDNGAAYRDIVMTKQ